MEQEDYHFKFKIVILGEEGVGKTTFLDCTTHSSPCLALTANFGKVIESSSIPDLYLKVCIPVPSRPV